MAAGPGRCGVGAVAQWGSGGAPGSLVGNHPVDQDGEVSEIVRVASDVVSLVVLLLLYAASEELPWRDLRTVWRPVVVLAEALVPASAAAVAAATGAVAAVPASMAFVPGAVLASTDQPRSARGEEM